MCLLQEAVSDDARRACRCSPPAPCSPFNRHAINLPACRPPARALTCAPTALYRPVPQEVGYHITTLPEGFAPHRQIAKVYEARRAMVDSGEGVDWAMAEALAFGTLLAEGALGDRCCCCCC